MSANRREYTNRRATSAPEERMIAETSAVLQRVGKSSHRHDRRRTRSLNRDQRRRGSRSSDYNISTNLQEIECEAELKRFQKTVQECHEKLKALLRNASDASSNMGKGKTHKFLKTMKESREQLKQLQIHLDIQLKPTLSPNATMASTNFRLWLLQQFLRLRPVCLKNMKSDLKNMIIVINTTLPNFIALAKSKPRWREFSKSVDMIKPIFVVSKMTWETMDNMWTDTLKMCRLQRGQKKNTAAETILECNEESDAQVAGK